MPPILEVAGFGVRRATGFAVDLPCLTLRAGEVAALYGPSGCGKSSLLQGLFGLLPHGASATGAVRVGGRDVVAMGVAERRTLLRSEVVFLVQGAPQALDPLQPVAEQVVQACGCSMDAVGTMLGRLGVRDAAALGRRLPHAIAGGQAQRVLLAIAFLRRPQLVVADEPSDSLDEASRAELVLHLRTLVASGSAVLLATHDHRLLADMHALVLSHRDGTFVPGGLVESPWPARTEPPADDAPVVLSAQGLRATVGGSATLQGVDLAVRRGEVVALVGASGAGKTTLARILAGHAEPDGGTLVRPRHRTAVQLVAQDPFGSLTPGRSLHALLDEAQRPGFDRLATAATLQLPADALARDAARLSGGERRRAALLRAMAVGPEVLVLDEPTASLDRGAAVALVRSVLALQTGSGLAVVLVTHDRDLAVAVAHRVLLLQGGRLCPAR